MGLSFVALMKRDGRALPRCHDVAFPISRGFDPEAIDRPKHPRNPEWFPRRLEELFGGAGAMAVVPLRRLR